MAKRRIGVNPVGYLAYVLDRIDKTADDGEKPKLACTDAHDAGARGWT